MMICLKIKIQQAKRWRLILGQYADDAFRASHI